MDNIQLDDGYSLHADYVISLPNMRVYITRKTQNDTWTWKRFGDKDWWLMSAEGHREGVMKKETGWKMRQEQ